MLHSGTYITWYHIVSDSDLKDGGGSEVGELLYFVVVQIYRPVSANAGDLLGDPCAEGRASIL